MKNLSSKVIGIFKQVFGSSATAEQLQKRLALEHHVCISLVSDLETKKAVGYAIGHEKKGKYYIWMLGIIFYILLSLLYCYLYYLGVLESFRGRGGASGLIGAQIQYALKEGFSVVSVKSSPKWKNMLRLLIGLDFIIIGYKANEWGDNAAVWFEKKVK